MAAGDATRAWFPDMLEDLRVRWKESMPWASVIIFCNEMTKKREVIKKEKGIKPLKCKCGNCAGDMTLAPISVRSLLFALKKIEKIQEETFSKLDKDWKSYQRKNNIDAYGNIKIKKS